MNNQEERNSVEYSTLFLESLKAVNEALRKYNEGATWEYSEERETSTAPKEQQPAKPSSHSTKL